MRMFTKIDPLTPDESRYAAEHYGLIHRFLQENHLSEEDFFDVVVFGYLQAVKHYLEDELLQKWAFSTIAWQAMRRTLGHHREKEARPSRKAILCSLDTSGSDSSGMNLYEVLPDETVDIAAELEGKMMAAEMLSRMTRPQRRLVLLKGQGYGDQSIAREMGMSAQEMKGQKGLLIQLFTDGPDAA